jgi:predicted AAA+ superfamily ATPase
MRLVERFLSPCKGSFFLFGPRGTGKTFWLRETFPNAHRVDLLQPAVFRQLCSYPEKLGEEIDGEWARRGSPENFTVVVDEIQRVPALLDVVHGQIVDHPGRCFALTGSSARKLRRGGVNLLAGRAILRTLHPFLAGELGDDFAMGNALRWGMLPVVLSSDNPAEALTSYVGVYLEEEIRQEALVRGLDVFGRFLEVAAFSHGSLINHSAIARECGISPHTAESYLTILHDLFLAFSIPNFTRRPRRREVRAAKFYFCDVGVYRSLRPPRPGTVDDSAMGLALEGLVAQHLRAWCDYSEGRHGLHHWRTADGAEVDFVICGEDELLAFEVKSAHTPQPKHLGGLHRFQRESPAAKLFLLHGGDAVCQMEGVTCIPCETFLRTLRPNHIPRA